MSTDPGWDDYLTTGTDATGTSSAIGSAGPVTEPPAVPAPVLDAVETSVDSAANAQDWSDWHADNGDSWADSAQHYIDYAQQSTATGWDDAANSAMETAATHAGLAQANYDTADEFSASAGSHLDEAVQQLTPYDSGASFDVTE